MPSTRERVPAHTSQSVNAQIRHDAEQRVQFLGEHPEKIPHRLRELDEEWDIERAIEANAAVLAFGGVFQHAVQGWCPPVPILRRLGFRTSYEIEEERRALQALRGDFANLPSGSRRGPATLRMARSA